MGAGRRAVRKAAPRIGQVTDPRGRIVLSGRLGGELGSQP